MYRYLLISAVLAISCGCAVRRAPATYRVVRDSGRPVLVPPGVAQPTPARRKLNLPLLGGSGRCRSDAAIEIRRHGKNVRLSIAGDMLARQTPGWLTKWASDAEAEGCVAAGDGTVLASSVVDSVPLPLGVGWSLLNLNDIRAGYVDLNAGNRLQVDSPIFEGKEPQPAPVDAGTITSGSNTSITVEVKAPPGLVGFERSWYAVQPRRDQAGFSIIPLSAERHVKGDVEATPEPSRNYFEFDPGAGYYRLLYRSDRTIVLLGAARYGDLDALTREAGTTSDVCRAEASRVCAVIPNNVGVNLDVMVRVNGREVLLPAGAKVANAIRATGASPTAVLARLRVQRVHAGRLTDIQFDHASDDILGVRLSGGEAIDW